jgi:hypothetical protein
VVKKPMITEITRGHMRLRFGDRTVRINGEMLVPARPGDPDFVVYRNSIQSWDPPFDKETIQDETRAKILQQLQLEWEKRGGVLEIE